MRRLLKTRVIALGVLPVVSAVACTKQLAPPGELVVAVSTDVSIPKDIDTIRMQVISAGVTLYNESFPVFPGGPAGVKIPATLGIVAGSDPNAPVLVRVIAISKQKALVLREATAQVPTDRTALLQLPLQWLSYGSAVDSDPLEPKAPDPTLDGITEANCKANETEVAGHCESDAVDTTKLPTFDPGLVFGGGEADGGGGKCFDTLGCFPSAGAAKLDMSDCTLPMPEAANASKINVAFMPGSGAGICNETQCFVPVDSVPVDSDPSDGWTMKGGKIQLPIGFCDKIKQKGLVATVTVSTGCASKTSKVPTCGPWSTEGNGSSGGSEDGGAAHDATVGVDAAKGADGSSEPTDSGKVESEEGGSCMDGGPTSGTCSTTLPGVDATPGAEAGMDAAGMEAGTSTPPSCVPVGSGTSECGSSSESCCTSLEVAGGTPYYRTYTNTGSGATGEADVATVSSFRLDKYLVTVGRFRQFVNAWKGGYATTPASSPSSGSGKHTHLNGGQGLVNVGSAGGYESGWDATDWNNTTDVNPTTANLQCESPYNTWTDPAGSNENLPINCVTWYESYAFCIWDGGFLPSEAEWEYAAAGGSQQLEYPWGSTDPGTLNQYAIYGSYYTGNATDIAPVGTASLGAGYWHQLDLAGEVWEWNLDWYAAYAACTDCANAAPSASVRVVRGGYFNSVAAYLLPPYRIYNSPSGRDVSVGFRCARTP